jgi:hypothetical protein
MTKQRIIATSITLALVTSTAFAETVDDKIARAMSAAPADISADATIMDVDGTILHQGSHGWVCLPGVGLIPGDEHPMHRIFDGCDRRFIYASGRCHGEQ